MRGKYNRKKKRKNASAQAQPSVAAPRIDQTLPAEPNSTEQRQEAKEEPVSFLKLVKGDPRFTVEVFALIAGIGVLVIYICQLSAMRDAVKVSREANKLTEDALRADLILSDRSQLLKPIEIGDQITARINLKNVGRTQAVYGYTVEADRWNELPSGDIPLRKPDLTETIDPDTENPITISDTDRATKAFIEGIPNLSTGDLQRNPKSGRLEPSSNKTTLFFIGRFIYESIGKRREKQFCFYIAGVSPSDKRFQIEAKPPVDPNYTFLMCPKWNSD